jgi:hypothetical protein
VPIGDFILLSSPLVAVSLLSFLCAAVNKKTATDLRASRIDTLRSVGGSHQNKLVFDHLDKAVSDEKSQHSDEGCGHASLSRVNDPIF